MEIMKLTIKEDSTMTCYLFSFSYHIIILFEKKYVIKLIILITHWEELLDSDWLIDCESIRNLRANSVIRGKLQISRANLLFILNASTKKQITINN